MKRKRYANKWACCDKTRMTAFCDSCGRPRPVPSARQEALSLANDFDAYARGRLKAAEELERQIAVERDAYPPHEHFNQTTTFEERWALKSQMADGIRQCAGKYLEWAKIIRDGIKDSSQNSVDNR